jgi:hypothetical protein
VSIEEAEERTLGRLLASFREVGQLDSRGAFTMSGRKAAGKLASSLLPDPADWILKVVQSACQGGAPQLSISQTNKATHIELSFPYLLDIRALESSLTRGVAAQQPGVEELCTALRVVGLAQDRAWVARLKTGETTHWVLVKDGEVSLETVTNQKGETGLTELLIGVAFPPGQSGKLGGLVRFGAAIQNEHEALQQRARTCPVPLVLDGRPLLALSGNDRVGGFEHELFLGACFGSSPRLPPIRPPHGLAAGPPAAVGRSLLLKQPLLGPDAVPQHVSSIMRVAYRYQTEKHARGGRACLFRPLPTPSRVLLVRHGVVVGKRNLGISEPIAVDVYLNGDEARASLTGLEAEVLQEHMEAARQELGRLGEELSRFARALVEQPARPTPRQLASYGGLSGIALLLAPVPLKLATLAFSFHRLRDHLRQSGLVLRDCQEEVALFQRRYCQAEDAGELSGRAT